MPPAHAYASLSGCLSGRGSGSVSGTTLTLTINLTITCTATDPKDPSQPATFYSLFYMDFPVYEIQEELFSSSACNGPLLGLTRMISGTNAGIVTCRFSNSSRYGATTSTLKIYAGDSVFVPISHPAIPKPSSSGGSSSGSTSGGNTGTTVFPTCTAAPNKPNLSIEWNSMGPKFSFSPSVSGSKATALYWGYTFWSPSSNTWDGWSSLQSNTGSAGSYQAKVIEGKTSIAFTVIAENACGESEHARESENLKGVPFAVASQDEISYLLSVIYKPEIGSTLGISDIAKSKLQLQLTAKSLSDKNCTTDSNGKVSFINPGDCVLEITSVGFQNKIASVPTRFTLSVKARKTLQKILDLSVDPAKIAIGKSISLEYVTSAGLDVLFESQSELLCSVFGTTLLFLQSGSCALLATQAGNENIEEALPRNFNIWIPKLKTTTIFCTKGKSIKKISAAKPKCPSGYKKN